MTFKIIIRKFKYLIFSKSQISKIFLISTNLIQVLLATMRLNLSTLILHPKNLNLKHCLKEINTKSLK